MAFKQEGAKRGGGLDSVGPLSGSTKRFPLVGSRSWSEAYIRLKRKAMLFACFSVEVRNHPRQSSPRASTVFATMRFSMKAIRSP